MNISTLRKQHHFHTCPETFTDPYVPSGLLSSCFIREKTATPTGVTPPCTHQHIHQPSNPCYHKTGLSDFPLQTGKKFSKICSLLGISKKAAATTSALITFNPVMLSKQTCVVTRAPQCSGLFWGTQKLICIIVGVCCHWDDVPSCGSCWGVLKVFWLRGPCSAPGWPLNLQTTGRLAWRNTYKEITCNTEIKS